MSNSYFSLAVGVGTKNRHGEWLEVFYPCPLFHPDVALWQGVSAIVQYQEGGNTFIELDSATCHALEELFEVHGETQLAHAVQYLGSSPQPKLITLLQTDAAPASIPEAYLKLHLLSYRQVKPHDVNLEGLFSLLPTVAWTSDGAIDVAELPERQLRARSEGRVLMVHSVDKFPKMTDYVVPSEVRIAHTARVRLGAYVGKGTTVMHEGFINFNAGTHGKSMVEGRISAGVMVGEDSDLGGGCSTMGTLSGGHDHIISVGSHCLIGANAGLGISLGDRCTIEAGLYLTAASKVCVLDKDRRVVGTVKAKELMHQSDLLFRRNSMTGAVECLVNNTCITLNDALHAYN